MGRLPYGLPFCYFYLASYLFQSMVLIPPQLATCFARKRKKSSGWLPEICTKLSFWAVACYSRDPFFRSWCPCLLRYHCIVLLIWKSLYQNPCYILLAGSRLVVEFFDTQNCVKDALNSACSQRATKWGLVVFRGGLLGDSFHPVKYLFVFCSRRRKCPRLNAGTRMWQFTPIPRKSTMESTF